MGLGFYELFILAIIAFFLMKWVKKAYAQSKRPRDKAIEQLWLEESVAKKKQGSNPVARASVPEPAVTRGYVLVADESSTIRHLVRMVLRPEGFGVPGAKSATAALQKLNEGSIDLVIVDRKLWEEMNRHSVPDGIPMILLNGSQSDLIGNVRSVLPKPFESGELMKAVDGCMGTSLPICPVCDNEVEGVPTLCPNCGASHHSECFILNSGCGSCDYKE